MALSPPFTIRLPMEEYSIRPDQQMNRSGNESAESYLDHLLSSQQQADQLDQWSPFSGEDPTAVKKLTHNASEREHRRKIKSLYSTLRSLLPAADQMKKLSNPAAIARAVKYVPELQLQLKGLIKKKEELMARVCKLQGDLMGNEKQRKSTAWSSLSDSAVAVTWLNDTEVVLQISSYVVHKSPLSQILVDLEQDGLVLLNASSFESFEGRLFHSLHLQVQVERSCIMESNTFSTRSISYVPLYEKRSEGCFPC